MGGAAAGALNGTIIALDILDFEPIEGVTFIKGDFREAEVRRRNWKRSWRSAGRRGAVGHGAQPLGHRKRPIRRASRIWSSWRIEFAQKHLTPQGSLVCKVFHGSGYSQLVKLFKMNFRVVKPIKPKASRDKSSETFLVGIGLKTGARSAHPLPMSVRNTGVHPAGAPMKGRYRSIHGRSPG